MHPPRGPSTTDPSALLRQVFDQRFQFMAILDAGGVVVDVNGAPVRRGLAREDFLGRHIGETPSFATDPAWVSTWNARMAETREAGEATSYEDVFCGPDGATRSADAVLTPVFGVDGITVDRFVLEAEDTTEQRQVELALRASERRFHDFAESVPVLAWSTDASGECDFLNRRWLDYTGAAPGQHHGWSWIDAVHPEDRPELGDRWTAALGDGTPAHAEYRIRRHDGTYRWFDLRAEPVHGDEGEITRWYCTGSDVHEAHTLRQALQEREAQLIAALEAGRMARFSYDLETRRFTSDEALTELFELPASGRPSAGMEGWAQHIHPDDRSAWQRAMRVALDPQTPTFEVRYRLMAGGGRSTWVGSRGRVEFDAGGRPRTIVGVVFALPGDQPEDLLDPRD